MMTDDRFTLTPSGLESLQRELARMEDKQAHYIGDLADLANDSGDMEGREVGAYEAVVNAKVRVEGRLRQLRHVLNNATIIEYDAEAMQIQIGHRVKLWDMAAGDTVFYNLLSQPETIARRERNADSIAISASSPVGQALIGKQLGDIIEVAVPDGIAKYCVYGIEAVV
jgi:transcription elongation factor GreA